jgi:hypothetical protein
VLTTHTVHDHGFRDLMTGSSSQDWFLFNADGYNDAKRDWITDLSNQD